MVEIVLYTKMDCPLCDEAKQLLVAELGRRMYRIKEIDIEEDPELLARYRYEIPVVLIDGKLRFRGRVDLDLLRRLLRARERNQP